MQVQNHQQQFLMRFCRLNFCLSAGIAGISLLGWVAGTSFLTNYKIDYIPISPSTALLLLLLNGVLLIYVYHPDHRKKKNIGSIWRIRNAGGLLAVTCSVFP